jgi:adenylate cyclase
MPVSPQEVARRLGVRYVLEGNARRAADRLRIVVKLIDAADGAQIWGDRFDEKLEDVFALQDKVALAVAGIIEPAVQAAEFRRVSKVPTENMGAYDLYLRASALTIAVRRPETEQALSLLERAIDLDPDFALALAAAASCHRSMFHFGWTDDPDYHRRAAFELVDRALRSGAEDAGVLVRAASALMGEPGDRLDRATALIDQAISLNPGSAHVWQVSGMIRMRIGEPELALGHLETALRLDPLSGRAGGQPMLMAIARFQQGRFDEALALFRQAHVRTPFGHAVEAALLGHLGHLTEAQEALSKYRSISAATIETTALNYFRRAEHQKLFLDGIALAEGEDP